MLFQILCGFEGDISLVIVGEMGVLAECGEGAEKMVSTSLPTLADLAPINLTSAYHADVLASEICYFRTDIGGSFPSCSSCCRGGSSLISELPTLLTNPSAGRRTRRNQDLEGSRILSLV